MSVETLNNKDVMDVEERNDVAVDILQQLIALNIDGASAYETAAELLTNDQYADMCRDFSKQRNEFADELRAMAHRYGGLATEKESMNGLLQDAWMNLRNLIDSNDAAVITECDRSDELAINLYFESIDAPLPEDVEQLIRRQFGELKGEHERVHRLAAALQQA